ncbi:MAG TPA: outer membrane beta-barrel protein, partial [Cyclobacteriaceae bacterium]|nr:outer membrane beta-barrel protein [Cyclobacteriaceae bacterium]
NFFYSEIIGENIAEGFNNSNFSWTLSFLSNITIPNVMAVQVQADYRGPIVLPQGEIEPIYGVNIGLRKEVLKRKGTVSLNVSDVFNTRVFRVNTEDIRFNQERLFNRETRIGTITFTYRFGGFREKKNGNGRDDYEDDPF